MMDLAATWAEFRTRSCTVVAPRASARVIWLDVLRTTANRTNSAPSGSAERSIGKLTARGIRTSTGPAGGCHQVELAQRQPSGSGLGAVAAPAAPTRTGHRPPSATGPVPFIL